MKVFNKSKREMWVSNNRVLVGGSKKVTGRNPNFDTDETRLLISLWGDPKVQKTLITTHKKHAVIARLADKMRDYGYQRSAEEINTRIKNLKCFYNRIKKDMETGSSNEPTWKHFAAMDEIMTRPIFSVRPNEIPKPSLRYKLEEAKREREERGETLDEIEEAELMRTLQANNTDGVVNFEKFNDKKIESAAGNPVNDSEMEDNDNEDNENLHEDDMNTYDDDTDYEPVSARNNHNSNIKNNSDDKSSAISLRLTRNRRNESTKNNDENQNDVNQNSIDIEEPSIIKDEPIDVDDDSNDQKQSEEDKESDSFPLAEYLKASASNNYTANKNKIITTVAASLNSSTPSTMSTSSSLKLGQATSIISMPNNNSVSNNVSTNSQAKISLVPTNFLLKPQSQNLQEVTQPKQTQQQQGSQTIKSNSLQGLQINRQIPIRPKPSQPRIIYTHQATGNQPANGIVNTSNGPMKVLLVNALQKNTQNVQNIPTATILQNKSVEIQNNALYQSSSSTLQSNLSNINKIPQSASVNLNGMVSSTSGDKLNLLGSSSSNSKTPIGYRALLGQLIRTQDESNQINRQRLQLERERFEYEKSAGERFLKFLPDVIPNFLNIIQQQHPHHRIIPEQNMTQSIFVTAPIVSAVENINTAFNETQANKNSEIKEDTPLVLLTPKKEKEDD